MNVKTKMNGVVVYNFAIGTLWSRWSAYRIAAREISLTGSLRVCTREPSPLRVKNTIKSTGC